MAYLRTLDDSLALKEHLGRRLVLIGGGWIGLEVASAARAAGGEVTVVESLELPLLGALGSRVATTFAALHREHGVDLRLGASVEAIEPDGDGAAVRLADGSTVSGDLVVVGIGATARDDLARAAGLPCDGGVLVDARLEAAPGVFAAGDVAQHDHPVLGRRIRVEHWDTAIEQGTHVAGALLGEEAPYTRLPYFFTDQYDLGMEYVGNVGPEGFDEVVVRGDEEGRVFTAFWLGGGQGAGRDARQRLGRDRPDPGPGRPAGRPGAAARRERRPGRRRRLSRVTPSSREPPARSRRRAPRPAPG